MEKTPIIVLVEQIKIEAETALGRYNAAGILKGKLKRDAVNDYLESLNSICSLSHAIEKLNQA